MVFGIFRCKTSHGIAICHKAGALRRVFKVGVQLPDSSNVGLFTLGLRAQGFAAVGVLSPALQLGSVFQAGCEGITPIAQSYSPVGNSASWVFPEHGIKSCYGAGELEGMQEGDGP